MFYITPSVTNKKFTGNVTYSNYMGCKIELAALQTLLRGLTPAGHVLHLIDNELSYNMLCKGGVIPETEIQKSV